MIPLATVDGLTAALIAIFSVGGAASISALWKGINGWRAGVSRKEARAIQNLEKYRDEADWRAEVEAHRGAYRQDVAEYWRNRCGDAEHKIRTTWGASEIPPHAPEPVYVPLIRPAPKAVTKAPDNE